MGLEVVLSTLTQDVHSGLFGGSVDNAPLALARLLSTLHDEHGAIAVEGYYEYEQMHVHRHELTRVDMYTP